MKKQNKRKLINKAKKSIIVITDLKSGEKHLKFINKRKKSKKK